MRYIFCMGFIWKQHVANFEKYNLSIIFSKNSYHVIKITAEIVYIVCLGGDGLYRLKAFVQIIDFKLCISCNM